MDFSTRGSKLRASVRTSLRIAGATRATIDMVAAGSWVSTAAGALDEVLIPDQNFVPLEEYPGWGLDGEALHEKVPAMCWCVTKLDLKGFEDAVSRAIRAGDIQPGVDAWSQFDPSDDRIGPSMYIVNDQFIKPTTLAAGKMSWALMCHPEGLKCDLFITHAWQEGVFEFSNKALSSWPYHAKNAYICFLANPQNLDISSLVMCPKDSPFAKALASAPTMLVIPNEKSSIYGRLWCAYEAYKASDEDKLILTAKRPTAERKLRALTWMTAFVGACAVLGVFTTHTVKNGHPENFALVGLFFLICSMMIAKPRIRCISNWAGAGFIAWISPMIMRHGMELFRFEGHKEILNAEFLYMIMFLTFVVFFAAEIDGISQICLTEESKSLKNGYVPVDGAQCSSPSDDQRIREEIGERVDMVDGAVAVLMKAGMSTRDLRIGAQMGINVAHAGRAQLSAAVLGWGIWVLSACHFRRWAVLAMAAVWIVGMPFFRWDRRVFAVCSLKFIFGVCIISSGLETLKVKKADHSRIQSVKIVMDIVWHMGALLTLGCSMAGLGRIARIPYCGKNLVMLMTLDGSTILEALGSMCHCVTHANRRDEIDLTADVAP